MLNFLLRVLIQVRTVGEGLPQKVGQLLRPSRDALGRDDPLREELVAAVRGHAACGVVRLLQIAPLGELAKFRPDHGRADAKTVPFV